MNINNVQNTNTYTNSYIDTSKKSNIDETHLSKMLENREDEFVSKLGVEYVDTHKVNDFYEINQLFSDPNNLEQRLARDYETRYNKIKEAVSENPNLKSKEKELIKKLDNTYNEVLDYQANLFANAYTSLVKNSNEVKRNISEEFNIDNNPLEEVNDIMKKEVKNDYINFFKNITNQIKDGKSVDDIKEMSFTANKHIKTYEDIRAIHKASQKMFSFYMDTANTRMRLFAGGSSLDEKVTEFNKLYAKFNTNIFNSTSQNIKKFINSAFDFETLFSNMQSKLYKNN